MLSKTEQEIKNIILKYIDEKDYDIFIFGSRALSTAKKYSDYDIGIKGVEKIPLNAVVKIKNALEDSDIPYCVDIVDFLTVSQSFKREALKKIRNLK